MITVDEYVEARMLPQFHDIVTTLRQIMREAAPDAEEIIRYGMPVYRGRRIFAWINQGKNDITLAFSRGAQFEDRYGRLQGAGKSSRHVRIKRLDAVNKEALDYYIRQALVLDEQ